jgi:nucleotide-binding universal stress UspA family protein
MIQRILLGYDGSSGAAHALDFAIEMARRYGAQLHVLAVARPPGFGDEVETEAAIEDGRRRCQQVLAPVRDRLTSESVPASFHVAVGHPAEQIIRHAEQHAVDHIVVGHRGHSLFERWLIGSVARQVIAYAHCAVTVQRDAAPRHDA